MARQRPKMPDRPSPPPGEVTITRMPFVRCGTCKQPVFYRPGKQPAEVLSAHYTAKHLEPATMPG